MLENGTLSPPLCIVGGGGLALEVLGYLNRAPGEIVSIIDFSPDCEVMRRASGVKYVGRSPEEFQGHHRFRYLIAVGSVNRRKAVFEMLLQMQLSIGTLVHPTAIVAPSSKIGEGVIVGPFSILNEFSTIEDGALVNVHCSVGHGATVSRFSVLSPYASVSGDAKVGEGCFLGTRATIFPGVSVGNRCVIDSHSFVKSDVGDKKIVSCRTNYVVLENRLERN